jgi:hypothetical protein
MKATLFGTEALEEYVIVGGCGGLFTIPAAQEADYYRAQKYMAVLGFVCLPLMIFFLN